LKTEEVVKRFGPEFVVAFFDGTLAIDILYKMLHRTRPYETNKGAGELLFDEYCEKVYAVLRSHRFKWPSIISGKHLKPLQKLLAEASQKFASIPCVDDELRPRIMLAGEFYVRLDDRCNKDIIRQIEEAGGEVSLAPASEFFVYTTHANYRRARQDYVFDRSLSRYLDKLGYSAISWLAHRDEHRLEHSASILLHGLEEPKAHEIREHSAKYIPEHTAGEPPMTVGRTGALAGRERMAGAIFVGPFTCMPASVVEAQQTVLSRESGIPIISVYYDGRDNTNRDEFIHSLVFQAKQNLMSKRNVPADESPNTGTHSGYYNYGAEALNE
jgi:predicted nucleotide-binding protein (sugar kinase/HSP70/actin superfamily)